MRPALDDVLATAIAEGRDVTNEELAASRQRRNAARAEAYKAVEALEAKLAAEGDGQ